MHGQFLEYHIACHIFILEGRPSFVSHQRMCPALRVTPKLFWGEGGQSDIFEKIVEKESESVKANILEFLPVNTIY